jgi:fluoride exporter
VSAALLVGVGLVGGLGAVARLLVDRGVSSVAGRELPLGTLAVNVTGSFALGVLVGAVVGDDALRLAGTGFIGAYTTFSTWMFESHRLEEEGGRRPAVANVVVSLALGLLVAWAGKEIGGAL